MAGTSAAIAMERFRATTKLRRCAFCRAEMPTLGRACVHKCAMARLRLLQRGRRASVYHFSGGAEGTEASDAVATPAGGTSGSLAAEVMPDTCQNRARMCQVRARFVINQDKNDIISDSFHFTAHMQNILKTNPDCIRMMINC